MSLLFKPPSIGYVLVAVVFVVLRAQRERGAGRALVRFGAGVLAPIALTLAYFASCGALGAMIDIVVRGNAHHARTFPNARSAGAIASHWLDGVDYFSVVGGITGVALAAQCARARRTADPATFARGSLGLALSAAALFAVTIQLKFFDLHWATFVGPMTFVLVASLDELRTPSARVALVVALLAGYAIAPGPRGPLVRQGRAVGAYVLGRSPGEAYAAAFAAPQLAFAERDTEDVAASSARAHGRAIACARAGSTRPSTRRRACVTAAASSGRTSSRTRSLIAATSSSRRTGARSSRRDRGSW